MAVLLLGCGRPALVADERLDKGLVMVLTGVEGLSPLNLSIRDGLDEGGVDWAIDLKDWTTPLGPVANQRLQERNREEAARIGEEIVAYQDAHPGKPVVLIGHSGGTAIAIWAVESLPEGRRVDGVILLASSVSKGYNLAPALERIDRGIVNFYSTRDALLLGLAARAFGTMDGRHGASGGLHGFGGDDDDVRPWAYDTLYQFAWTNRMTPLGHYGGHNGYTRTPFVKHVLAPLIKAEQWSMDEISRLILKGAASVKPQATGPQWPAGATAP
ncbi:MAG: alpha/beta fold hydrolase [Planctomycetota bacterium]